jgi:hypothetical protein
MFIHHMRKTTMGSGGNMSCKTCCGGKVSAKPHRRMIGTGMTPAVFDSSLGVVKPTRVLQNIRIKKSNVPKKYITFE